jgi:hypothetical protein
VARDQTDLANDPGLGGDRGRHSHESALRSWWAKHIASVLNAIKPDQLYCPRVQQTHLYKFDDALGAK